MVGLDQQSAPKQLINEVPSHVVLVDNKVGATHGPLISTLSFLNIVGWQATQKLSFI